MVHRRRVVIVSAGQGTGNSFSGSCQRKVGVPSARVGIADAAGAVTLTDSHVRAYDYGGNRSPFSETVSITTPPPNPNDTTPPTVPTNLDADTFGDGSTETRLRWTQSTDDFDAQSNIRYDVYVNGVLQDILFGSGGPSTVYADFGVSLIEVFATDTEGNTSAPATVTVVF